MFKKIILIFIASSLYAFPALAARTDCVSQMALADTSGNSITTAVDYELHFYPSLTGGAELTTAVTGTTTPSNGVLSIPFDCSSVTSNAAVFMEYVIDGETLSPRVEMVSNPFAAVAFTALNVPSGAISDDSITTNLIVDGTITASDISSRAIETSAIATSAVTTAEIQDGTIASADVAADTLDFTNFADNMTLDFSTDIAETGANTLSLTNSGTANSLTVNDQASDTTPFVVDNAGNVGIKTSTPAAALDVNGIVRYQKQTFSISDDGAGTKPTATLTPTSTYVEANCLDGDGCIVTIDEIGAVAGQVLIIVDVGGVAGGVMMLTVAGAQELSGGIESMSPKDSITLIYASDRWVELSRSSNT